MAPGLRLKWQKSFVGVFENAVLEHLNWCLDFTYLINTADGIDFGVTDDSQVKIVIFNRNTKTTEVVLFIRLRR